MFDKLDTLLHRYEELMQEINNPALAEDPVRFRKLMKEQSDLTPIVETYQAYADYHEIMNMVEEMFEFVAMKALGTTDVTYQGQVIHLKAPWKRITMADAVMEATGEDYNAWQSDEEARAICEKRGVHVEKDAHRGNCLEALFDAFVEEARKAMETVKNLTDQQAAQATPGGIPSAARSATTF